MRHIYNRGSLPLIDPVLLHRLDEAAERLLQKLAVLDLSKLPLTEYGREDLRHACGNAGELIKKYAHILAWLQAPGSFRPDTFVDYGGGHGLLACLAREAGFSHVVYNDIFDQCCDNARVLARHIGCEADNYVCGDILAVQNALGAAPPPSCALSSINVIEHIYDLNAFIDHAAALTGGQMSLVLSTSANPMNPLVRRRHFRQHREWEFKDGPHESSYPMDSLKAFRTIRQEIIMTAAPDLSAAEVATLADATRGLRKVDIESCVRKFRETGIIPVKPEHPTNTCDPLTGSWQERLLDIPSVTRKLEAHGFAVRVLGGYYSGTAANPLLRKAKHAAAVVMNQGISLLGSQGARLAPSFMFHATRR